MRREKSSTLRAFSSVVAMTGLALMMLASVLVSVVPTAQASNEWITIVNFSFTPNSITINVGDTVTWQNNASSTDHTATSTSAPSGGAFDSGVITPGGGTYSHPFTIAGSYSYHCTIHASMTGTIVVSSGIPEFSSLPFVVVGLLVMMLGLVLRGRTLRSA